MTSDDRPPPVPWITLALMALFVIGGSIGLLVRWPHITTTTPEEA